MEKNRFPLLEKLAQKLYCAIAKEYRNPEGLTVNASRGKQPLLKEMILSRRHVDAS